MGLFGVGLAREAGRAAERIEMSGVGIAPESLTSTPRGAIFIGSGTRKIYRAEPGDGMARPWADGPADGPPSIFGVFADERARVLWACAGSVPATDSELYAFGLDTGDLKARYPLPTGGGICNDIAVSSDGTVFVTDSTNMQVARLRTGEERLEVWAGATSGTFGDPAGLVDGIAVLEDRVLVNTLISHKLFSIQPGPGGEAGPVVEVVLDRALAAPDGMRGLGANYLLVAESGGDGALARIAVTGNKGLVETVRKGFERGVVAVTVAGRFAYVLGNRPVGVVEPGEAARFEAVSVALR